MILVIILLSVYVYQRKHLPVAVSPVVITPTSMPSPMQSEGTWKTYSNTSYGFSFQYPSIWKLKENNSEKSVTITSNIGSGVGDPRSSVSIELPLESITFQSTDKSFFTPVIHGIAYDENLHTLVDVLESPQRCLPAFPLLWGLHQSVTPSIQAISYGGSIMSDPANDQSAILTQNGLIVAVNDQSERGSDADNTTIQIQIARITNSFRLLGNNTFVVPACAKYLYPPAQLEK